MESDTPEAHKDDLELEDSLKSEMSLLSQQVSLLSNSGKWLQIVKNSHKGSFSRTNGFIDNKIPRHLVSLDEKYLRRCLELINISAFKSASCSSLSMNLVGGTYHFDLPVIPKENVARLLFDLPLVDDSGSPVLSPIITGCKKVTYGNMLQKAVSLSSKNSTSSFSSSSSEQSVCQGTIQFTMKDNKTPHFVFSLDDDKEFYVASLTNSFDRSSLDYSYLIRLKKARGFSEPQRLVGKVKVSTLFSVSPRIVERQFVLFSNGGNPNLQLPRHDCNIKKNRGLTKKVVDALKSTRSRSISRFSRASSIPQFCSWEPFQETEQDLEPVSLLDNDLPTNLETLAVVVREEQCLEEEVKVGGWGMKFLKKKPLVRTENASTSIDVVIPAGIHGGTRKRNGGPSSLIERWKSGGSCECSGWDLGCPLTVFKGQECKDRNEGQCNLFELITEGTEQQVPGLRIMNVKDGLYFVQFQAEMSVLQSFSIALAYIHSQSQRLRPWLSKKCTEEA